MSIITITRGQYSGGEEIAQNLADRIGAKCVSVELLRESANQFHVADNKIEGFFEKNPNILERITNNKFEYVAYIRATLLSMCKDNNLVYHGNAGQELLRDIPHVLKVRLMLSSEFRARRIMELFDKRREEAIKMVEQIDEERTKHTEYYYEADWRNASRYDLMIRMDGTKPPFVENTILEMLKQPKFQLTEKNEEAFHDALLQGNLQAMAAIHLGRHTSLINLSVKNRIVTMEGNLPNSVVFKMDQLIETFRAMEEIRGVLPNMTAGFSVFR